MNIQSIINPGFNIQDTLIPNSESGWLPMDEQGLAFVKPLWASPESGGWAVLFNWKAGFIAPAHKHLGAIHAYVVSGKMKVRDMELSTGDYVYEANGVIHDAVTTVEDTIHLNIGDGPILFFDDSTLNGYFGWEQVEAMKQALTVNDDS